MLDARRWDRRSVLALSCLLLAGCGMAAPTGPTGPEVTGPRGGTSLDAEVSRTPDGGLAVDYEVTNRSLNPVVLTDGVPAADTTRLPEVDPEAAYVRVGRDGVVEIARRTFEPAGGGDADDELLMTGSVLSPGETRTGRVRLPAPVTLYEPYAGERPELPPDADRVTFCVGVVDLAELEVRLQGQVEPGRRVLRHPTRQLVLCTPEVDLPR